MKILFIVISVFFAAFNAQASMYELNSKWKTIENKVTKIDFAKGRPVVIAMIYTGCAHACPMTIAKLKDVEKSFQSSGIKEVQYILASFDIEGDTPERLKEYQKSRELDENKWHFLSASSEKDIRELAVALGISYKKIGKSDFSHSNIITLLDEKGNVLGKLNNLNSPGSDLVKFYKK